MPKLALRGLETGLSPPWTVTFLISALPWKLNRLMSPEPFPEAVTPGPATAMPLWEKVESTMSIALSNGAPLPMPTPLLVLSWKSELVITR
jgi:hypothetical protein